MTTIRPQIMNVPPTAYAVVNLPDDMPLGMVFSRPLFEMLSESATPPPDYYQVSVQSQEGSVIMGFTSQTYETLTDEMLEETGANSAVLPLDAIREEETVVYLLLDAPLDGPTHLFALCANQDGREIAPGSRIVGLNVVEARIHPDVPAEAGRMLA